jgi:hypothetical protein
MATNTYVALQKTTLTSAASSVTLSSIPQGYTDLIIVCNVTAVSSTTGTSIQFNADTGSNYSQTWMRGSGSAASSGRDISQTIINLNYYGDASTTAGAQTIVTSVMNYSNTTTNKTLISRGGNAESSTSAIVGLWRNTSAITRIDLKATATNFASGSTFTLYGILANSTTAKATGGTITSDASYWYHTFTASGTFAPSVALSADVLVIAGGASGGGFSKGGGGGAGGVCNQTSRSISPASYSVTVGGGGAGASSTTVGTSGNNSIFDTITALGGGGGGADSGTAAIRNGASGGSGGGGSRTTGIVGTGGAATQGTSGGATGFGNAGGDGAEGIGASQTYAGGGGGGSGAAGAIPTNAAGGAGGAGKNTWSSWTSTTGTGVSGYFAAGGGGQPYAVSGSASGGTGGLGGGGTGGGWTGSAYTNGTAGTTNTGSGGGGGSINGSTVSSAGGSGIVIVRYAR